MNVLPEAVQSAKVLPEVVQSVKVLPEAVRLVKVRPAIAKEPSSSIITCQEKDKEKPRIKKKPRIYFLSFCL